MADDGGEWLGAVVRLRVGRGRCLGGVPRRLRRGAKHVRQCARGDEGDVAGERTEPRVRRRRAQRAGHADVDRVCDAAQPGADQAEAARLEPRRRRGGVERALCAELHGEAERHKVKLLDRYQELVVRAVDALDLCSAHERWLR